MKYALTTTLNDAYFDGFLLTFNSILRTTADFNYDLVIFEWGELSDNNKNIIYKLYKNVIYKKIDQESYKNHKFKEIYRKWPYNCNYRFDIFTLNEYDKILYFDCDILFELSVDEILKYNFDFGACQMPNYKSYEQVKGAKIFNAGIMLVGKRFLNKKTKQELINLANTETEWTGNQPIFNNYFLDKMEWLPNCYNLISEDINFELFNKKVNYHFVGHKKPWNIDPNERFDKYILHKIAITTNGNIILNKMIYKKINEKYISEFMSLKEKGINLVF